MGDNKMVVENKFEALNWSDLDNYQDGQYLKAFAESSADPLTFEAAKKESRIYSLNCGHSFFYTEFLLKWLKDNQTCPNCRKPSETEPKIRNFMAEELNGKAQDIAEKLDKFAATILQMREEMKKTESQKNALEAKTVSYEEKYLKSKAKYKTLEKDFQRMEVRFDFINQMLANQQQIINTLKTNNELKTTSTPAPVVTATIPASTGYFTINPNDCCPKRTLLEVFNVLYKNTFE